jgi:DNA polymerase III epsilon subunit-like protein
MATLFFDTETTGLPIDRRIPALQNEENWPQLVSLSWSLWSEGKCVKRGSNTIKPQGWTIPAGATAIHGISQENAENNGVPLIDALMEFKQCVIQSDRIVAHNMEFDKNVIFHAFAWHLKKDPRRFWPEWAEFCSMNMAKDELKIPFANAKKTGDPYKMPGLDEVYRATFNMPAPAKAHSSDRDVEVLEKIYWARWPPSPIAPTASF